MNRRTSGMTLAWPTKPIRFSGELLSVPETREAIDRLYGKPGVYVYIVATDDSGMGVLNVYGGKAENLGWRFTEHATATLGLMYELYDGASGERVFPPVDRGTHFLIDKDTHFLARVEALAGEYRGKGLEYWQSIARGQLTRTEFWPLEIDKTRHVAAEGQIVAALRRAQKDRPHGIRCINARAPRPDGTAPVPAPPRGTLLADVLANVE